MGFAKASYTFFPVPDSLYHLENFIGVIVSYYAATMGARSFCYYNAPRPEQSRRSITDVTCPNRASYSYYLLYMYKEGSVRFLFTFVQFTGLLML